MSAVDYPAEGLPDEHEQFQQYNLNGDISVVFTVKDDIEYLPTFLESIRTLEAANSSQINDSVAKRLKELRRAYDVQRGIVESAKGREAYNAAILANHLKAETQRLEKGGIE